ncbi:GNAT family N-acetyltransferase [Chloroflexota bacterium]
MSYLVAVEDFETLTASWSGLLRKCGDCSVFLTPQWQKVWWNYWGVGELSLLGVHCKSELAGVIPLVKQGNKLSLLGSSDVCDYLDFIALPEDAGAICTAAMDFIDALEWDTFDLYSLSAQAVALEHFIPLAKDRGYGVQVEQEGVSPQLDLPSGWEDYLSVLKKKNRHELKRKLRRLFNEDGVTYYSVSELANLKRDMDDFLAMFLTSHEGKADFLTPRMEDFFRGLADSLASSGNLRLYFMEIGGVRVAAVLGFDYGDTFFLYNSGYDPRYTRLSVGLLLKALCIKESIASGKRCFDFLRGSEKYKYQLGGSDYPVYRCIITRN